MRFQAGGRYRIRYRSDLGQETERVIDVLGVDPGAYGGGYVRAFCHLRDEERTFRLDRVIDAAPLAVPGTVVAELAPAGAPSPSLVPGTGAKRASDTVVAQVTSRSSASEAAWHAAVARVYRATEDDVESRVRYGDEGHERASNGGFGVLAAFAACLALAMILMVGAEGGVSTSAPRPRTSLPAAPAPSATVAPPPPEPAPLPAREETVIGGRLLVTVRNGPFTVYEVPSLGYRGTNKPAAIAMIRTPPFVATTGLYRPDLLNAYLFADANASGKLSYDELAAFQKRVYRDFEYRNNDVVLRPDEFFAQGGGDCDDFAAYTAGLLRYWGWEPYIGCYGGSAEDAGHAVCLAREPGTVPAGFTYVAVTRWTTPDGIELPSGSYVPIDYDRVGALSSAVEPRWKLREVYIPERTWGTGM